MQKVDFNQESNDQKESVASLQEESKHDKGKSVVYIFASLSIAILAGALVFYWPQPSNHVTAPIMTHEKSENTTQEQELDLSDIESEIESEDFSDIESELEDIEAELDNL